MTVYAQPECFCGQSAVGHPQCGGCLIFAGHGHYDARLEGGLCESCRAREALDLPREDVINRRARRAAALALFESSGLGAVRARFRLRKDRARKWIAQAQRERATA